MIGENTLGVFDNLIPYCTVRLAGIVNNEVVSTGTGFFYFFNDTFTDAEGNFNKAGTARLAIVTNKHVVEGMEEVMFFFNTAADGQSEHQKESLRFALNENTVIFHPEPDTDLCVILTDDIKRRIEQNGRKLHIYPVRKNIKINENDLRSMDTIQDIVMIGYPRGIWDAENNLPIIRKGINATPMYESYQGQDAFAVDIAIYPGSSGSPVFIYNNGAYVENGEVKFGQRFIFVGVISSGHSITSNHTDAIKIQEMLHIGIAIKACKIDIFEELIMKHYES